MKGKQGRKWVTVWKYYYFWLQGGVVTYFMIDPFFRPFKNQEQQFNKQRVSLFTIIVIFQLHIARIQKNFPSKKLHYYIFFCKLQAGFLIPVEMVSGRMTLLVTLFLVLINIFNTITNKSPNVEGMSSISAWMMTCIFFVFAALLGYAGIIFKQKYIFKKVT